jgi:hypothetical protein
MCIQDIVPSINQRISVGSDFLFFPQGLDRKELNVYIQK